jgi:hypothetical protein
MNPIKPKVNLNSQSKLLITTRGVRPAQDEKVTTMSAITSNNSVIHTPVVGPAPMNPSLVHTSSDIKKSFNNKMLSPDQKEHPAFIATQNKPTAFAYRSTSGAGPPMTTSAESLDFKFAAGGVHAPP